jgi:hypothetical protein
MGRRGRRTSVHMRGVGVFARWLAYESAHADAAHAHTPPSVGGAASSRTHRSRASTTATAAIIIALVRAATVGAHMQMEWDDASTLGAGVVAVAVAGAGAGADPRPSALNSVQLDFRAYIDGAVASINNRSHPIVVGFDDTIFKAGELVDGVHRITRESLANATRASVGYASMAMRALKLDLLGLLGAVYDTLYLKTNKHANFLVNPVLCQRFTYCTDCTSSVVRFGTYIQRSVKDKTPRK